MLSSTWHKLHLKNGYLWSEVLNISQSGALWIKRSVRNFFISGVPLPPSSCSTGTSTYFMELLQALRNITSSPLNPLENFIDFNQPLTKRERRMSHYCNSGSLFSYPGGGVMGSMVTGFCVGVRIWRRKSFRCSLSDFIRLTLRGFSSRLARLALRVGRLGCDVRPEGSAGGWAPAGAWSFRGLFSVELLAGCDPSFSTAARMSS